MTVQHVNGEIIGSQVHGLEDLIESHDLAIDLAHPNIPVRLQTLLDKAQQMFLVHAGSSVDVSVDLPDQSEHSINIL